MLNFHFLAPDIHFLVLGFQFLAFGFQFLALGFPFLVSGAEQPAAAEKLQFLAPNPLRTLRRLQKCRALLVMTIPSKRDALYRWAEAVAQSQKTAPNP